MSDNEPTGGQQKDINTAREFAATHLNEAQQALSAQLGSYAQRWATPSTRHVIEQLVWLIHPEYSVGDIVAAGVPTSVARSANLIATVLEYANTNTGEVRSLLDEHAGTAELIVVAAYTELATNPATLATYSEADRHTALAVWGPVRQAAIERLDDVAHANRVDAAIEQGERLEERLNSLEGMFGQTVMAVNEISAVVEGLADHVFSGTDDQARQAFRAEVSRRQQEVLKMLGGNDGSAPDSMDETRGDSATE